MPSDGRSLAGGAHAAVNFGSRGAADALATRLEQLRDSAQDHGFEYAVECLEDARDNLARIAAGEVRA